MKRVLTGVWLLLIVCISGFALPEAKGIIKGKVVDVKSKEALEFVNISVRRKGESALVKGTITDQNGTFLLDKLDDGQYTLVASYIGYKPYEKDFAIKGGSPSVSLKTIPLSEDSNLLEEVQVVGQKAQMRFEIDKKVFNVDQNIASAGGSASDVLTNIPSVEVDNEGEVSLRGSSSVTVWINGKASGLTADNRAQILEQMPAESIEKIEVITNPSAKYSPEGTAGIINIVLKADRKPGYYGSVQAGADLQGGYNASANINYSSGKIDAYASLGYRRRSFDGGGYTNRLNTTDHSSLDQTTESERTGENLFTRLGLTYHLTKKDQFSVNGFGMFGKRDNHTAIHYISKGGLRPYTSDRFTDSDEDMNIINVDLGYRHEFNKDHYLDLTVSRNQWRMDNTSYYTQNYLYEDGSTPSSWQQQDKDIRSHYWEVQLDYFNKLTENSRVEAGYKGTFSHQDSPVTTYEAPGVLDEQLYNQFLYNQDIHALYATYSGRIDKFGYQVGLRGEYSKVNTRSLAYGETKQGVAPYTNDYFSLFPSLFLSYQLPGQNELQVNYTRRISRPWGGQLNSFVNITDSTNISFGNPKLSPQYSNAFELNYIKNWENHMLSFSGYYRTTDDVIQQIRYLDGNIMKSTYENIARNQSAGVELVGKNKLFKFLDLTTTVNLFYYKLDGFTFYPAGASEPVVGEADKDFSWNARMIANVILPYSISFQLTGSYNARQVVAQGYRKANYSLDAGIRKSFWNKKLSVSINARDLLDSRARHIITSGTGFTQDAKNWRGGRRFALTVTYSFGNIGAKSSKNRKTSNDGGGMMSDPMESDY